VTRVCVRCGWLVLEGSRCPRDHGPAVPWKIAAKACMVVTLFELLNLTPLRRVIGFVEARDRLRAGAEAGGDA